LDLEGQPCEAFVESIRTESGDRVRSRAKSDGLLRIGPLAPGEHEISARAAFIGDELLISSALVRANAGSSGVVRTLRSGAALGGRIVDSATGSPTQAVATLSRLGSAWSERAVANSSFELTRLEPGTYFTSATSAGGLVGVSPPITVVGGQRLEDLELVIQLRGQVRVHYDGLWAEAGTRILRDAATLADEPREEGLSGVWCVPAGINQVVCTEQDDSGVHELRQEVRVESGAVAVIRFDGDRHRR